jgi:hypothetical protein
VRAPRRRRQRQRAEDQPRRGPPGAGDRGRGAREAVRKRNLLAAQVAAGEKRRADERAAKEARADRIEAEIRKAEPFVVFHAAGKTMTVRLAHATSNGRDTAIEAVRRLAWQAVHRFQDKIVASRGTGAEVPERTGSGRWWRTPTACCPRASTAW